VPFLTTHDGLTLAYERSGTGTPVLFAHANGFCKELWRPIERLLDHVDAVALDQRGHGSSQVGPPPFDWWDLGRDVLCADDTLALGAPRVGVGHSSGGAALAMSEILRPGTWARLVLIEPIIYPGPYGRGEDHPLVLGALRRREALSTREDTRAWFAGRGPFARWTAEALDLYVEHGFRDGADGARHLACAPQTEAEFYRTATTHRAWDRLGEVACPVVVVVGADSTTHPAEFARFFTGRFPRGGLVSVAGGTHFVPMERPEAIAEVIGGAVGDG